MKSFLKHRKSIKEKFNEWGAKSFAIVQQNEAAVERFLSLNRGLIYGLVGSVVALSLIDCADAVTVASLRAPIQELKEEIFGGWMWVIKIAVIVIGAVFSVIKQSLMPFGISGGISSGIHFGDKWIGDASAAVI